MPNATSTLLDAPGTNESENESTPEADSADRATFVHAPAATNSGCGSGAANAAAAKANKLQTIIVLLIDTYSLTVK